MKALKRQLIEVHASSSRNIWFIACVAASHPASCPAHNCNDPAFFMISGLIVDIIAFPIIRLNTSPIPIGRTPEYLSRGISLAAVHASKDVFPLIISTLCIHS